MAEQQSTPVLQSTADPTPYVPVSWMAVAAAVVSGGFVILLAGLGLWDFFVEKKPLLLWELLVFPVIGVVLSFAGRRMIRNSEGTRTGESLVNVAWWGSVVTGLSFGAYLMAIDFSIRRDGRAEVDKWLENITRVDPSGANLNAAFIQTLDPDRRRGLSPDNPAQIESEFRDQFTMFKQSDLVRLVVRNPGDCRIDPEAGHVKDWSTKPYGFECQYAGVLKCREGIFPFQMPVRGVEPTSASQTPGRKWLVLVPQSGLFVQDAIARTPYGLMIDGMERLGLETGKQFFAAVASGSLNYPLIYHSFIGPIKKDAPWAELSEKYIPRIAIAGGLTNLSPYYTRECADYYRTAFFKLPGGGEPSPEQKQQFKEAWETLGLVPPGTRFKYNADKVADLVLNEKSVHLSIPCELPVAGQEMKVARCRLILEMIDPKVLAAVNKFREEANPDRTEAFVPELALLKPGFMPIWRVLRVESNLDLIKTTPNRPGAPNAGGDAPGGPGAGQ